MSNDPLTVITSAGTKRKSEISPKSIVKISELPIYPEVDQLESYVFVEDPPLPGELAISTVRQRAHKLYDDLLNRFTTVRRGVGEFTQFIGFAGVQLNKTGNYFHALKKYLFLAEKIESASKIESNEAFKYGAIAIGGVGGYLLAARRSRIRRVAYSATAALTVAAFCHPRETVDIVRKSGCFIARKYTQFKSSPEPPTIPSPSSTQIVVSDDLTSTNTNDSADMYTTRTPIH